MIRSQGPFVWVDCLDCRWWATLLWPRLGEGWERGDADVGGTAARHSPSAPPTMHGWRSARPLDRYGGGHARPAPQRLARQRRRARHRRFAPLAPHAVRRRQAGRPLRPDAPTECMGSVWGMSLGGDPPLAQTEKWVEMRSRRRCRDSETKEEEEEGGVLPREDGTTTQRWAGPPCRVATRPRHGRRDNAMVRRECDLVTTIAHVVRTREKQSRP
jgi:hypothetical protein